MGLTESYTPMAYRRTRMVIIETKVFTKLITELLADDEYKNFQEALINRPDLGDLIKALGGLRKVHWNLKGHR